MLLLCYGGDCTCDYVFMMTVRQPWGWLNKRWTTPYTKPDNLESFRLLRQEATMKHLLKSIHRCSAKKKCHIQLSLGNRIKKTSLQFWFYFLLCFRIGAHLRIPYTDAYYDSLRRDRIGHIPNVFGLLWVIMVNGMQFKFSRPICLLRNLPDGTLWNSSIYLAI